MKRRLLIAFSGTTLLLAGLTLALFQSDAVFTALVRSFSPEELTVDRIEGDLAGPAYLTGVNYRSEALALSAREVALDWRPWALLGGAVRVVDLRLGKVGVIATESDEAVEPSGPFNPTEFSLPVDLVIEQLRIDGIEYNSVPAVSDLDATLKFVESVLQAGFSADVLGNAMKIDAQATLDETLKHTVQAQCDCDAPLVDIQAKIQGNQDLTKVSVSSADSPRLIQATARNLLGELTWELTSRQPTSWSPDLPLSWDFVADGSLKTLSISGGLQYDELGAHVEAQSLELTDEGIELRSFGLTFPDHGLSANLNGQVPLLPLSELNVSGTWMVKQVGLGRVDGELKLTGPFNRYAGTVDARNQLGDQTELRFSGDQYSVKVTDWETRTQAGTLRLTGTAQWLNDLTWQLDGIAESFDPGRWIDGWPGKLDASISGRGQGREAVLAAQASGELRARPVSADVALSSNNSTVEARALLESEASSVELHLSTDPSLSGDLKIEGVELDHWVEGLSGHTDADLKISGTRNDPRLEGNLTISGFTDGIAAADTVRLQAAPADEGNRVIATAEALSWKGQDWGQAQLELAGSLVTQRFEMKLQGAPVALFVEGSAQSSPDYRTTTIEARNLVLDSESLGRWQLRDTMKMEKAGETLTLAPTCLDAGQGYICANSDWNLATRLGVAQADASGVPLLLPTGNSDSLVTTGRTLDGSLRFDNEGTQPEQLVASLAVSPGTITLDEDRSIELKKLEINARGDTETLNLDADMKLDELSLLMEGTLSNPAGTGEVDLSLSGRIPELGVYGDWVPQFAGVTGAASLNLQINGQIDSPEVDGSLSLTDLNAEVIDLGISLTQGTIEAEFDGRKSNINARFQSGEGSLESHGNVFWQSGLQGDFTLRGESFRAANLPELDLTASPDLALVLGQDQVKVTGAVRLDEARVSIGSLSTAVPLSKDVVVVDDPDEQQVDSWPLEADIEFDLGDAVRLEGYGLDVTLGGRLRVREQPGKPETGTGRVDLEGTYTAFGQELEISSGRLLFAEDPLDDPALDLRARRLIDEIEAGITVSGRARAPTIDVYSVPALEQSEALSYLVLGRPLNSAGDGDADLLSTAALGLGVAGSNRILSKLASGRGFATIGIANRQALGGAAFSVARYLSPRLYLTYSIGLEKAIDLVELQYQLSRRWSLESEVGEETRGKLTYKIERGRPEPAQ